MTKEEVLKQCRVSCNIVFLPSVQLDRKLYQEVAKVLEGIGGKWDKKMQGFLFKTDPTELLAAIADGEKKNLKKEFQFFATPYNLAKELVGYLGYITEKDTILEPSAGQGAIIQAINEACTVVPDCYELMEQNIIVLKQRKDISFNLVGKDFLQENNGKKYTNIVANPPFSKDQDIIHVREMYSRLTNGGILVSIMSESWCNPSNKRQQEFNTWLTTLGAYIIDVEPGTFKESGTMVGAKIVVIVKNE